MKKKLQNLFPVKMLCLAFLLLLGNALLAQRISGKVTDANGDPLVGATVSQKGTNKGATTGADGSFSFTAEGRPPYVVVITYTGFNRAEATINGGSDAVVNVALSENQNDLDEVVVTGVFDQRTALNSSIAITTLSTTQIDKLVPVSATDLLKNVPGVYVNSSLGEVRNTIYSRGVTTGNNDGRWGYDYVSMQEDGLPVTSSLYSNYGPDFFLRTHTSSVQVRYMENNKPPISTISPGRVFRNEAVSSRSHCIFHQVEGLYIDKEVSFADLKQTLLYFTKEMFGKSKIRLRPSYFPFTEPSAEVDIYWGLKTETDYRITKGTGWLEIMGCGMVDPNVLKNCGINPDEYNGFAFGMGIERIAMLLYQIGDIRMFYENDVRFLEQFKSSI